MIIAIAFVWISLLRYTKESFGGKKRKCSISFRNHFLLLVKRDFKGESFRFIDILWAAFLSEAKLQTSKKPRTFSLKSLTLINKTFQLILIGRFVADQMTSEYLISISQACDRIIASLMIQMID